MNKAIFALLLGLLGTVLAGCASLSNEECLNADWKIIGFEDGAKGKPESTIGAHRKACAKVNITPDLGLYQRGHREGARKYCVINTAYPLGANGGAYYNICPPDLEPDFLRAYRAGQDLYAITRQINSIQSNIDGFDDDIHELQADIAEHEKIIVESNSSSSTRREQLRIIDDLRREITHQELSINNGEREIYLLQQDYQRLQNKHRKMGYQ